MLLILLLLFLAVIVLGRMARENAALRIPTGIVTGAAVILAVVHLTTFAPDKHLPIDIPPEEALGFVLATQVREDFPEGGKVIVFQPETDAERLVAIYTARMDGVRRALQDSFEIVTRGPLLRYGSLEDRQAWFQMETGFPLTSFRQWAAEDGDAVAAISMLGVPAGRLGGKTGLPPLYVVELRGVPWSPNHLPPGIASVVTYRADRELDPERTKELVTVFEQNFTMHPPPQPNRDDDGDPGSDPDGG